jgi:glycosyltransferase involved in cell wall biosynthesis
MNLSNSPKISVIVPVYNVEKYLQRALNSLQAQTFTDWEAICVNDGSTDNCLRILKTYADKDSRFKIIDQPNLSLSTARNNGLKEAKGEYIYFFDSDDFLHPQCFEIIYESAVKNKAELVSFGFCKNKSGDVKPQLYDKAQIKAKITTEPLFYQTKRGKFRISFNVWTKLYKRELLKNLEFIPKISFQDYPHTFAVLLRRPKTVILDVQLYFYTINPTSISAQKTSVKTINDYCAGIIYVVDAYQKSATPQELKFIKNNLVPNILEKQLKRCKALPKNNSAEIRHAFAQELIMLQQRGFLQWRGHKLLNYFTYKKLIKEAENV